MWSDKIKELNNINSFFMTFTPIEVKNNASSSLKNPIISVNDTIIELPLWEWERFESENFPLSIYTKDSIWRITIYEQVFCTSRTWDSLTVIRWYWSYRNSYTTNFYSNIKSTFPEGAIVEAWINAEMWLAINTELERLETDKLNIATYNQEKIAYSASSTWDDDYEVTISWITSYVDWQTFKIKADVPNTWASSLKINSLSVLPLKKLKESLFSDLETNDIIANQIFFATYNSSSGGFFQFSVDPAQVVIPAVEKVKFGWNWSDWILNISSGTTTLTIASDYLVKNYESITISWTAILQWSWNWNTIIKCKWNFTMTWWTIDFSWCWWLANSNGKDISFNDFFNTWVTWVHYTSWWAGWAWWVWKTISLNINWKTIRASWWGGWGNGWGWTNEAWIVWWKGGWLLIIEVWWTITFTWWIIKSNWLVWGSAATNSWWWWGWWGWTIGIIYNILNSITGWILQCNWGNGWAWWPWSWNSYWWGGWGWWSYSSWWVWWNRSDATWAAWTWNAYWTWWAFWTDSWYAGWWGGWWAWCYYVVKNTEFA